MKLCSFNLIYLFNIFLCIVLLKAHLLCAWYCTFEYDDQKYLNPFFEYTKVGPKCLAEEVAFEMLEGDLAAASAFRSLKMIHTALQNDRVALEMLTATP
ncbi:hypothetical protein GBA52_009060 [Prunus armeniaca]|nr:hypothetical protein GBA52_009060 [Prunus armeniaca]